ncbi:MAG: DUF1727 domain-containing protein [Bacilli bacterium]|nr:DUF1727 domain-containing protein [Bacilli bacterium]
MYRAFLIILNKLISFVCHMAHKNGSVYPGSITFNLNRRILTKIKYPKYFIVVTGSSGKGSTCNLIYNALTNLGYKVVFNNSGSNGVRALCTIILNNCNIFGRMKADVLLLEADERHIHMAFPKDCITHLVITNITRDQPARSGTVDSIGEFIFRKITNYTKLIINGDDPVVNTFATNTKCHITKYGIDKTTSSFKKPVINNLDHQYCPKCHTKLVYNFYHYGQMGDYYCPNCNFKRNPLKYVAQDVDLNNQKVKINKNDIHITKDQLYTVYATLAAYATLSEIGINEKDIIKELNNKELKSKRGNIYHYQDQPFIMLESKNENALSYYQSLKYITNTKGHKSVILGFDNVSRRYKYNDLSWLYDVEFELLNDKNIDKIFVIGRFKYDILNRLELANIDHKKIVLVEELTDLKTLLKKIGTPIYTMVCFDMTYNIKQILKEDLHD